jgi:ketosteroid isomerase-like protein
MSEENPPIQTIRAIYQAFGQGNVPAILERCDADAEFSFEGGAGQVAWHGPWRGHAGIGRFFAAIGESVEFTAFEPLEFAASSSAVAVLVHLRYRVRKTGKVVDQRQVHWWSLRAGKVTGLRHHEDTAQVLAAVA